MAKNYIGIGLRHQHLIDFKNTMPNVGFVEVHSENYLTRGGIDYELLMEIRQKYPVSLHGIGMSLGSSEGLNIKYLEQLKLLEQEIKPFMISDHLSWSKSGKHFVPDLIPFPFNQETLELLVRNIDTAQQYLGRSLLLENPSSYFEYNNSTYLEPEFLNMICEKTKAKILLDLNNIYISGLNNDFDPYQYIDALNSDYIKEFHLSGHSVREFEGGKKLFIDSHNDFVANEVWHLYNYALEKFGRIPSTLEWDDNIPKLDILVGEAKKAEKYLLNYKEVEYV